MDDESKKGPIYNLKTRYRSHKLKVVLYIVLQLISVVILYLLVIYVDEYRNISKLSLGKMDYNVVFIDDTYIKMDGWVEVNSALSTTLYLKEAYVNVFMDSESDIEEGNNKKAGYNDNGAPPITVHVPFEEPHLIQPGVNGRKTTTKLNVTGNIIPEVLSIIVKKVENNIAGKLKRFRFFVYPTLELRVSFFTFVINTSLQMSYNFIGKGISKEVKEVKTSDSAFSDKIDKVFRAIQLSTHISLSTNPFSIKGIQFKYFFICFQNTRKFCFKGELKELELFPLNQTGVQSLSPVPSLYNFNTIIEFTTLEESLYGGANYIYNILSLNSYRKTYPLTKVTMTGKWGKDYWLYVDSRNTFTAYRHVNLKFTIGNAT